MPFILFQNTKIHYQVNGRGNSTVVLLHGFLEDLTMWESLSDELLIKHHVISVDLLGHGKSENSSTTHSMSLMADCVNAVLETENVTKANIVGHSMGGYVALALAKMSSELIEKVILLNSTATDDSTQKKEDRLRAVKILETGKKQFINEAIPKLFAEQNRTKLSKEIEGAKIIAQNTSNKGISAALLGMREREESVDWIKETSIPVVYICGEEDPIVSVDSCIDQAKETNTTIHKIKDCGHMGLLEAKEASFKLIKKELN